MSIVRWPGLLPRWWRGADSINGFMDTFESAGQIDSANLAEEGLDRLALEADIVGARQFEITEGTRVELTAATGSGTGDWTQWNPTGINAFRHGSTISVGDNEVLIVRQCVQTKSAVGGAFGLGPNTRFRLRIAYNNGSITQYGGTCTFANGTYVGAATFQGAFCTPHMFLSSFAVITGPITLDWVELQYQAFRNDGAGGAIVLSPAKSTFYGILYKRSSA